MTGRYDSLIGIPWFRPDRYDAARLRMTDADRLPPAYADWLMMAEQRERREAQAGHTTLRVYVDDDTFLAFCREKGVAPDSPARSRYAANHHAGHIKAAVASYRHPGFWPGPKPRR